MEYDYGGMVTERVVSAQGANTVEENPEQSWAHEAVFDGYSSQ